VEEEEEDPDEVPAVADPEDEDPYVMPAVAASEDEDPDSEPEEEEVPSVAAPPA